MDIRSLERPRPGPGPPAGPRRARGRSGWPSWAQWNRAYEPFTIGVEEEIMLLHPADLSPAQSSEKVLRRLSGSLAAHAAPETHASVIELATGIHSDVAGAATELAELRAALDRELRAMGLIAASAGMYPLAYSGDTRVSGTARGAVVADSMRMLARREPTLALHVHVGVPDPEIATRVLNGLRDAVPVILALSGNSPFSKGCDTGFASTRTVVFQAFPRTGTARRFADYADYVHAVDALVSSAAARDPTFLWWDVRLQPALGTVEVRVMDAQTTVADTAALIALIRAVARLEAEDDSADDGTAPEVLAENRFLAARDGLDARLVDPGQSALVPVRAQLHALLAACQARGDAVDSVELGRVGRLASRTGAERQRLWAREDGLVQMVSKLAQRFAGPSGRPGQAMSPDRVLAASCRGGTLAEAVDP